MTVMRYEPWLLMNRLQRDIDRLLTPNLNPGEDAQQTVADWVPPVDIDMLVATEGGGTFTFGELQEDLTAVGFAEVAVMRQDEAMNSIVVAKRPAATWAA